jgi:hypothetical protein
MDINRKQYSITFYTLCLTILTICFVLTGCKTTQTGMQMKEGSKAINQAISNKTLNEFAEKAEPLIEEITGRKYDETKTEYKIVTREELRKVIFDEELPEALKMGQGMGEEVIKRQLESSTQSRSQNYIARYSNTKDILYIIPENIKPVSSFIEVKDEDLNDFVFLNIAHDMVHYLDDQYYDLMKQITKFNGKEQQITYGAVIDGSAAYVTKKIADRLNIPERIYVNATKTSFNIKDETTGVGKEYYDLFFTKGSAFISAIIDKKGLLEGFNMAFMSPPVSTRQIFYPEEYLNPPASAGIDCNKLLENIKDKLPTEGARSNITTLGTSTLQSALITQGIDKAEAGALAERLLNGIVFQAMKPAIKPNILSLEILNFKSGEDAQKYYSFLKKLQDAGQNLAKAQLNTSYKIIKDEDVKQEGFNLLKYSEIEIKAQNNELNTKKITAIIDSTSIVIGYINMNEQTKQDLMNIMNLIYSEQVKMKQI